jgi:hypothetical protein
MQRNQPSRRRKSGTLTGQQLAASDDKPDNLSELCEEFGVYGFLCSCDAAAAAISTAGRDVCTYQPFEAACAEKHAELCEEDKQNPRPGYRPQQAGMSTPVKLALGAAAGGTVLALIMNE